MTEQWRPIPGYEGLYDVSDQGRVRSHGRYVQLGHPGSAPRWQPGRILKPGPTRKSYLTVRLYREGSKRTYTVHRLVLLTFVGEPPAGMECCHGPGGSMDNRLSNLRWDTPAANAADQLKHGTQRNAFRTECIHGHEFTVENTYHLTQNGRPRRMCKSCCRDRNQARRQARKVSA